MNDELIEQLIRALGENYDVEWEEGDDVAVVNCKNSATDEGLVEVQQVHGQWGCWSMDSMDASEQYWGTLQEVVEAVKELTQVQG